MEVSPRMLVMLFYRETNVGDLGSASGRQWDLLHVDSSWWFQSTQQSTWEWSRNQSDGRVVNRLCCRLPWCVQVPWLGTHDEEHWIHAAERSLRLKYQARWYYVLFIQILQRLIGLLYHGAALFLCLLHSFWLFSGLGWPWTECTLRFSLHGPAEAQKLTNHDDLAALLCSLSISYSGVYQMPLQEKREKAPYRLAYSSLSTTNYWKRDKATSYGVTPLPPDSKQ